MSSASVDTDYDGGVGSVGTTLIRFTIRIRVTLSLKLNLCSLLFTMTLAEPHPSISHPDAHTPRSLHLFGYPIAHSVGPYVHSFVAHSLGLPWTFTHFETPNIERVTECMREQDFIGGAVTMPMKLSIVDKLSGLDDQAKIVGACNTITKLPSGKLVGSNTE